MALAARPPVQVVCGSARTDRLPGAAWRYAISMDKPEVFDKDYGMEDVQWLSTHG